MSELSNPLFDNERDFLERQKEEYRNALLGDVNQIKTQSQEIGKKVAVAGGVLLAGFLLRRMFSSGDKKKSNSIKKVKKNKVKHNLIDPNAQYDEMGYRINGVYNASSKPVNQHSSHQETGVAKSFVNSDLVQLLVNQVAALLVIYITKKVEEYLISTSQNNDIAPVPIEVTEVETTEIIYPEEDAV